MQMNGRSWQQMSQMLMVWNISNLGGTGISQGKGGNPQDHWHTQNARSQRPSGRRQRCGQNPGLPQRNIGTADSGNLVSSQIRVPQTLTNGSLRGSTSRRRATASLVGTSRGRRSSPLLNAGDALTGLRRGSISSSSVRTGKVSRILWAAVGRETGRGKGRFKIRDLFADEHCSQPILDFLSTTDAGRLVPTPAEEDIQSEMSEWKQEEERRAEAEELGAGGEE